MDLPWDLLTVPSGDGTDMRSRQDVGCRPYQPPLATAKAQTISQRQTGARWRARHGARETYGVSAKREPASGPIRGAALATSRENALCKGFETMISDETKVEIPGVGNSAAGTGSGAVVSLLQLAVSASSAAMTHVMSDGHI